jgi:hypothetical protein
MEMEKKGPSLLSLAIGSIVFVLVAIWLGTALGADDLFWFLPGFRAKTAYVDLYWDGGYVRVSPDDPEYELIQEALFSDLAHVESHPPGVGLSDESLEELRREGRLLELYFDKPTRIRSPYHFGPSPVYYIPLSGHHVRENRVFNKARGGPVELVSMEQIVTTSEAIAQNRGLQP